MSTTSNSSPSSSHSNSADSNDSIIIEAGSESPLENFSFRQCPAEFKLKIAGSAGYMAAPKASLLHISHSKGIILFPHSEKGKDRRYKKLYIKYSFLYFRLVRVCSNS